ncbi:MAG: cyclase family protein [Herpetosiphon sp.]
MNTIIDLSHRLEPGMPSYPGLPEPHFSTHLTHAQSLAGGYYAEGTSFEIAHYQLGGNTGTYVDAPYHRHPGGDDLATLPLERLADLPAIVVPALREGALEPSLFRGLDLAGKAVLIRTDWSERWATSGYFRSGPFLSSSTCHVLVEMGATLVGIDCANIDNMEDTRRPAHTLLLRAGIPIVEHLTNLDQLPRGGFRFFAVPPAIVRGTSFPVRAFALLSSNM